MLHQVLHEGQHFRQDALVFEHLLDRGLGDRGDCVVQGFPERIRVASLDLQIDRGPEAVIADQGVVDAVVESLLHFSLNHHAEIVVLLVGAGVSVPASSAALWCWLRGDDRGVLLHETRRLRRLLAPHFDIVDVVDAFMYRDSRDLSGYEDGTENPEGDAAAAAAIVQGAGPGLDGGSFAAVQRWLHDLDRFEAMSANERDHTIGRRHSDNEELEEAPLSAHVKRTAQEDFVPEAFVVRRSMPWASAAEEGLLFLAFGHSFDTFEAQLRRMVGADDGIVDALYRHELGGRKVAGRKRQRRRIGYYFAKVFALD